MLFVKGEMHFDRRKWYTSPVNHQGRIIWIRIRNSPKNVIEISRSGKRRWRFEKAQMHFCSDAQLPRSVKTAIAVLTDRVPWISCGT